MRWPLLFVGAYVVSLVAFTAFEPLSLNASTTFIATTSLTIGICGDSLVDGQEECDVPGETGDYSTTIAGRQCDVDCTFGPYCGDGVLQSLFDEECDDGNNTDNDFCSADCKVEPAGSGGGGSTGGGSGTRGGSNTELGDTIISVEGLAYPNETLNVILDAENVGTFRTNNDGEFDFSIDSNPGSVTLGLWSNDLNNVRSITSNLTFDVTQGAVTNVRGVLLPPTIRASETEINPGDTVIIDGQAAPERLVELYNGNDLVATTTSDDDGVWFLQYDTAGLPAAEYTLKARYISGGGSLISESGFSSLLSLFVGVDGRATLPADLSRDGRVNLTDFSILIFWWQTTGGNSNPPADINQNGNVGIEDFSILLFNWTG